MALAHRRYEIVEVWQLGVEGRPPWVSSCTEARLDGLYLVRRSGKQRIEMYEWLVRDLDGEPAWYTDEEFQREYELISAEK